MVDFAAFELSDLRRIRQELRTAEEALRDVQGSVHQTLHDVTTDHSEVRRLLRAATDELIHRYATNPEHIPDVHAINAEIGL